jgi:hypothetical protein
MDGLLELIDLYFDRSPSCFEAIPSNDPPPKVETKTKGMAVSTLTKQKELERAAARLKTHSQSLRATLERERVHVHDLLRLRRSWRIRGADRRFTTAAFATDYTYRSGKLLFSSLLFSSLADSFCNFQRVHISSQRIELDPLQL